jgi:hypothetical protein
MLNLIRGVLGIHHHRFNLSVKRSSSLSSGGIAGHTLADLAAGSLALRPPKLARRSTEYVTEMTRQMALVRKACSISNFAADHSTGKCAANVFFADDRLNVEVPCFK